MRVPTQGSRDIDIVIERMLEHVPPEERLLRASLERVRTKASYTAPEVAELAWEAGSEVLASYFRMHAPEKLWEKKMVNVWMGWAT